ncbi:dipeptidase PepE [Gemmatimonadota bacterium]
MPKKLLLISTSTVHGSGYLEYCSADIRLFLDGQDSVLFVPYARPGGMSHDSYTAMARKSFETIGMALDGIHEAPQPSAAVESAAALFVGGGNTFLLLRELYRVGVMDAIRAKVRSGMLYVGTSAGSNVAGLTIGTTNDMPIVYPPSFDALGLAPFNINPHYLDPDPNSTHRGETRDTRIKEFHVLHDHPVVGLREGAMLHITDSSVKLQGSNGARLFLSRDEPAEFTTGDEMGFLLS